MGLKQRAIQPPQQPGARGERQRSSEHHREQQGTRTRIQRIERHGKQQATRRIGVGQHRLDQLHLLQAGAGCGQCGIERGRGSMASTLEACEQLALTTIQRRHLDLG